MTTLHTVRGRLSFILAGALFLSLGHPALPASALETPGETTSVEETTAPTEATGAATEATEAVTEPIWTEAVTEPWTEAATEPPEIQEDTLPSEPDIFVEEFAEEFMVPALFSEFSEQAVFQRIYCLDHLVSGEYVLVSGVGYAPETLAEEWITAAAPVVDGDLVTDSLGAVWTLTVGSGIMLTDSCGASIAPLDNGENGIMKADYLWQVSCSQGMFSFHGSNGTEPVTLAGNKSLGYQFRAYRDSTVQAGPDAYPSTFALYRQIDSDSGAEPVPVSTAAQVRAMAEGTEGVALQGTVVYVNGEQAVLQDATGGILLSFTGTPQVTPGDTLLVFGRRTAGFAVTMYEITGSAECPAAETAISGLGEKQEYTRILIRNALLGSGVLIQADAALPISATLPAGISQGDTVDAYGVLMDGMLYVDTLLPVARHETETVWYPVEPEDILSTDIMAVTVSKDGNTWALSSENGEIAAPAAVSVQLNNGTMTGSEDGLCWSVLKTEQGLILRPTGAETFLYTQDSNKSVRVGTQGKMDWKLDAGYLVHVATGRYLTVYQGTDWRAFDSDVQAAGQTLQFWRRERVADVTMVPEGGGILPGKAITLHCATEGASIYFAVSYDGENYSEFSHYTGEIPTESGFESLYIKAYAVKEGCTPSPETACAFMEEVDLGWNLYFGQLHAHTDISDGMGSVAEAFAYAAGVDGLDFFAVTDHSNSFDNASSGAIGVDGATLSQDWAAGKAAAAAVTSDAFVGIFGYEMTWQEGRHLGHINTFGTPGWQSRDQEGFTSLESYYQALTTVPGSVSQFNHPGTAYGDFENFSHYRADYDQAISLLELGDEGDFRAYESYIKALDAGWHIAPTSNQNNHQGAWGDANAARTVVLAETLTEESLYDAMRNRRAYATQDSDLAICYRLDGHMMGSVISRADSPEISVYLRDPSDAAIGLVEVIADGGTVTASQTVESGCETITMTVPGGYRYYFLRITQPDGDIAVTAPVWVDSYDDIGILGFTADAQVLVQGREIGLTLELFNEEPLDFSINSIQFSVGGEIIHTVEAPGTVKALDTFSYTFRYTHGGLGVTEITASVSGCVNGETRTYERALCLSYQPQEMVSGILVDGSHGNFGVDQLHNLTAIAAKASMEVTVFKEALPEGGDLLLVSAPESPFEEAFLAGVSRFVEGGGSLIVCGRAGAADGAGILELNRLLTAIGSTLRLNNDTAMDDVNNGGTADVLYPTVFNPDFDWSAGLTAEQFYSHRSGCTVDAGSGTWLVKGLPTTYSTGGSTPEGNVLLACEDTPYGGTVLAAGCFFLVDSEMPAQKNIWDLPRANQSILEALLNIEQAVLPLNTISGVRNGKSGEVYRVQGYVTAGTSNPHNTFAKTIYLQDDTGGIAVIPFTETGIQVGTPMEVIGYLDSQNGNPVLSPIRYSVSDGDLYRYVPKTMYHSAAMNYAAHGGELLQVAGKVVSLTRTSDGKGISRMVLEDIRGSLATVVIEDTIFSGANGVNALASQVKIGRTVRAMGILHLDDGGEPVLRVRNCDEVVYVPPVPDPSNPKTGDGILGFAAAAVFLTALLAVRGKQQ